MSHVSAVRMQRSAAVVSLASSGPVGVVGHIGRVEHAGLAGERTTGLESPGMGNRLRLAHRNLPVGGKRTCGQCGGKLAAIGSYDMSQHKPNGLLVRSSVFCSQCGSLQ